MATIALTISATPVVTRAGLSVELTIRNSGDASARNVTPIVVFRGDQTLGTFEPLVEAGRSLTQSIEVPLGSPGAIPGTWPLYFRIAYADGNNHPFEALHVTTVSFGSPRAAAPAVTVDVSGAAFSTSGQATARLHSTISTEASVTFVVPIGASVFPDHASVFLEPGTRDVAAVVTNAGATASSRLPMFAVAEFETGGQHATAIGGGMLDITPPPEPLASWVLPAVLAALIVLWLGVLVRQRLRRA